MRWSFAARSTVTALCTAAAGAPRPLRHPRRPGYRRLAAAAELRGQAAGRARRPGGRAARRPGAPVIEVVPDAHLTVPAGRGPRPPAGQRAPRLPGLRGRLAADAARRRGIECSTGSACSAGVPQPSHVLLAMGCPTSRPATRCASRSGTPPPPPTSTRCRGDRPRRRARAGGQRAGADEGRRRHVRRSGLRRRRRPRRRGRARRHRHPPGPVAQPGVVPLGRSRLLHHRGRQRRPPRRRRARHPLLRLGPRRALPRGRGRGLRGRVRRRRTPNPCLRCNEKIKFAPCSTGRWRWASTRWRPATTRSSRTGADGAGRAAPRRRHGKDQSYVLGVLDQDQLPTRCSRSATSTKAEVRARPRAGGCGRGQARLARHLLRPRRRQRRWLREKLGDRAPDHGGDIVDDVTGEELGRHDGTYAFTIGQRKGLRIGPRPRRQAALRARHRAGQRHVTVGPREGLAVDRIVASAALVRHGARRLDGTVQLCAHGAEHRAGSPSTGDVVDDRPARPGRGHRSRAGRGALRRHPRRRLGHDRVDPRGRRPGVTTLAARRTLLGPHHPTYVVALVTPGGSEVDAVGVGEAAACTPTSSSARSARASPESWRATPIDRGEARRRRAASATTSTCRRRWPAPAVRASPRTPPGCPAWHGRSDHAPPHAWELWRTGRNPYREDLAGPARAARRGSRSASPRPAYSNLGFELLGHADRRRRGVPCPTRTWWRTRLAESLGARRHLCADHARRAPAGCRGRFATARAGSSTRGPNEAIAPAGGVRVVGGRPGRAAARTARPRRLFPGSEH